MPKPPLPWPTHWYDGHYDIRCIAPHCDFVTDANNLPGQWTQLHDHCTHTLGAEHALLEIMLRQSKCALCGRGPYYGSKNNAIRLLFNHESNTHGSAEMFRLSTFVVLARERRVLFSIGGSHMGPLADSERLAFDRMVEKVTALPPEELTLLFEYSGVHPSRWTTGSLRHILAHDPSAERDVNAPYWSALPPERFLRFCRPRGNDPADNDWRQLWRKLRERYADGRI